ELSGSSGLRLPNPLSKTRPRTPLFIAMRATDPPQHLLYFVRDPWPWGKPHEASGLHHPCWWRGDDVAARGARAAGGDADSGGCFIDPAKAILKCSAFLSECIRTKGHHEQTHPGGRMIPHARAPWASRGPSP